MFKNALRLFRSLPSQIVPEQTYSSYEEAKKNCSTMSGYENNDIVKVVFEKTKRFKTELDNKQTTTITHADAFNLLPFLKFSGNQKILIIDVGGACGAHYLFFKNVCNHSGKLTWIVVETPEMVKQAKALETDELFFYDDLSEALNKFGKPDLLFTSGTLQCVDDPLSFLNKMMQSGADYILFNRLGFTNGENAIIVNHKTMLSWNGIGKMPENFTDRIVEYPFTFIPKNHFEEIVAKFYIPTLQWEDATGIFPVNNEPIVGMGGIYKRLDTL